MITGVPTTVEEVKAKLRECVGGDNIGSRAMIGIFEIGMAQGKPLEEAYKDALLAYINAGEKPRNKSAETEEK
jgi:hypothetical protein